MQQYVVGNWKMNGTRVEATRIAAGLARKLTDANRPLPRIVVCPSFPYLGIVQELLENTAIKLGGQNCSQHIDGSYTGEVSAKQIKDMGGAYVILGHSERRNHFKETNADIKAKVTVALKEKLIPIICLGETHAQKAAGQTVPTILKQLQESLPKDIKAEQFLIAYEPVWAIGTGNVPSSEEIKTIHGVIRQELSKMVSPGGIVPILYGGSVSGNNAKEILKIPNVNGVLVGGASLKLDEFWEIIQASEE